MKRDFELIRKILSDVQEEAPGLMIRGFDYEEQYDPATIGAHVTLLIDQGLMEGIVSKSLDAGIVAFAITGLTWEGHDFIEAASTDTIWKKAFATVRERGGAMTFDVLKALLMQLALKQAGL
jgi:hypothetical protein